MADAFALSANAFKRCSPALNTNLRECGTVTRCQVASMASGDLTTAFMKDSADFRVMEALFHHDFEVKMCEAQQNGLYELFMAQKVNMRRTMKTWRRGDGLLEIAPFVLGRRYSPINDAYWLVNSGGTLAANGNMTITVQTSTNIPLSGDPGTTNGPSQGPGNDTGNAAGSFTGAGCTTFPPGMRLYIQGVSQGGSATRTAWIVLSTALSNDSLTATLILQDANGGSKLAADKLGHPTSGGIMVRGTPNINDFEKWCHEAPTYLNWNDFPYFVETTRNTTCKSSQYDAWRKLVMMDNPLYKEYFYLPDVQKNQQIMLDWQKRIVTTMFWGTASNVNQSAANYNSLPQIAAFDPGVDFGVGGTTGQSILGVDNGSCVGRRADAEGIYQQLAECNRIVDLQGGTLHLLSLFDEIYNMMRVRQANGTKNAKIFDLLTDSVTAENFSQAMLKYYNSRSDGMARLNVAGDDYRVAKTANFGFSYRSFPLFWPAGVTLNIISHDTFDDWLSVAQASANAMNNQAMANTARVLWILDLPGIYPGIIASNHTVHDTGDLKTLARINPSYACVMKVNTKETEMWSMTWTIVVECPKSCLVLENFMSGLPDSSTKDAFPYDGSAALVESFSTTTGA